MAAFAHQHTSYGNTAGGTTVVPVTSAATTPGNLLVAILQFDNASGSTSTPTVTGISKPAGESATWTKLVERNSAVSTGGSGGRTEIWAIQTTTSWANATSVTATLSSSVPERVGYLLELSGASITTRDLQAAGAASGGNPSLITSLAQAGDVVLGAAEVTLGPSSGSWTGDSDTTNGNWSADLGSAIGTTGFGRSAVLQYKEVTGTGSQTWDPTFSTGSGAAYTACLVVIESSSTTTSITVSATCVTSSSLSRTVGRAISASTSLAASVQRNVSHKLSATLASSVTVTKLRAAGISVLASVHTSASVQRVVSIRRTATSTTHATLRRVISKTLSASASTSTSLRRTVARTASTTVGTSTSVALTYIQKPFALLATASRAATSRLSSASRRAGNIASRTRGRFSLKSSQRQANNLETSTRKDGS